MACRYVERWIASLSLAMTMEDATAVMARSECDEAIQQQEQPG
jgi:hypothetical protein